MRLLAIAGIAAFVLSACGGGGGSSTPTAGVAGAAVTPVSTAPKESPAAATPAASAAGTTSASPGTTAPTAGGGTSLTITAPSDEKFDTNQLTAPAGTKVTLTFKNDSNLAHDWHLFDGADANAPSIAQTKIITGPHAEDTITFTTPAKPGRYFFHCDVHPTTMTGFLIVQ